MKHDEINTLCCTCEKLFNLDEPEMVKAYCYDSLPMCILDAVFSIGVRYTSTQNVVKNYCTYYGLREYNLTQDARGDQHTVTQFIYNVESLGVGQSADDVFRNHQRTSSRSGILKAEASLRFAKVLQEDGIETLRDFRRCGFSEQAEKKIRLIPGQKSGLALHYFYMLAGDDTCAKPDRHILRFIHQCVGRISTVPEAQDILTLVVQKLRETHPSVNVRALDHAIWDYMSSKKTSSVGKKKYHKLVRDRIPEIIEADGKTCVCETLSDETYLQMLDAKLNEELAEYQESKSLEELADLLEVIQAVVLARGWTLEQLEQVRADKAAKRGGFEKRILLKEVQK